MSRFRRRRPSPALVVALIALFVALGGPAQAARLINGQDIAKGSITGRQIKNHSLAAGDLSKRAVRALTTTPRKSVRSAQILDGQVLAPDLGAGAVTSAALADGTVGNADLAAASVSASKVAPDAIGGGSVANGSLQTVDVGSFTGAVQVDFGPFNTTDNRCQAAQPVALPTGGQPSIADDVVLVSPPSGWSDYLVVTGKPAPDNQIRIVACWIPPGGGGNPTFDPDPAVFRYVTFDAP
jgi:hypothetical protein